MPCSRHKKYKKAKAGRYQCQTCGQARKDKDKLCKPKLANKVK